MKKFDSIDEILDFAIGEEEKAVKLYSSLAMNAKSKSVKKVFEEFADEERKHKEKLLDVKNGKWLDPINENVLDLKITESMKDLETSPDMDYQSALIVAMKREKLAFTLYTALADSTDNLELEALLRELAQEEAKHKLRFELEYDDYINREN